MRSFRLGAFIFSTKFICTAEDSKSRDRHSFLEKRARSGRRLDDSTNQSCSAIANSQDSIHLRGTSVLPDPAHSWRICGLIPSDVAQSREAMSHLSATLVRRVRRRRLEPRPAERRRLCRRCSSHMECLATASRRCDGLWRENALLQIRDDIFEHGDFLQPGGSVIIINTRRAGKLYKARSRLYRS